MPLTDAAIRNLGPRDKPYKVFDGHGLFILVNPSGSLLWRFRYRFNGREKLLSLGSYPLIGLKLAREKRDDARRLLVDGYDPSAERQKRRREEEPERELTFGDLSIEYMEKLRLEGRAEQTLRKQQWLIDLTLPRLGSMEVTEIRAPDVLSCLKEQEAEGKFETAARMRTTVGSVIRYAIASGRAVNDPTAALKGALVRPTKSHRSAILDRTQLGRLLLDIKKYHGEPKTAIALQLLAMLATRPGELRLANWSEFDLAAAIWRVPADRTKTRRPHRVPLPVQALELLQELEMFRMKSGLLFSSTQNWKRPISSNTLNVALRRMGYSKETMTAHGFRATFSTLANESGRWNSDAIERALGHVEGNEVRRAYARGEYWEERVELAQWWADQLDSYALEAAKERLV
ncbi:tyrosine-type recombinase/integrase [Oceanicola sp. 502str15]|nr:tyrosine-type recombinase/integrase [Oceanicola sp. 502str15]